LRRLADAGIIGPLVFGFSIIVLTSFEHDFITGLGWDPTLPGGTRRERRFHPTERRSRMTAAKSHRRVKGTEPLVDLGIAGTAASAGAILARRFRPGAREQSESARASATSDTDGQLIGHEFTIMGHTFHILQSARDTEDGSLRFDYCAPPDANISEHTHQFQEESFEVVSGNLGLRVGRQELILTPGQSAIGPPRVPHAWWNPSDEERVRFVVGIRPGLEVEIMFETVLGLMRDGKTIGSIPKNPLQTAVLAKEISSWVVLGPLEKALFAPVVTLASVGGLFGYRARYPKYSGPDGRAASVRRSRRDEDMTDRDEN
jgi:mannose-6-phosphate isomerase-like protein (cupin superfamily)